MSFVGAMVILISLRVGWGIHLLLARVWHTFHFWGLIIVLWEGGRILDVSKKSFSIVYIPNVFFYLLFVIFMCSSRLLVYVSVFVCLFVHQCLVVQLSLSYGNLRQQLTAGNHFLLSQSELLWMWQVFYITTLLNNI